MVQFLVRLLEAFPGGGVLPTMGCVCASHPEGKQRGGGRIHLLLP